MDEGRCVTDEQSVACGSRQHADHRQPDVGDALRRVLPVPDTQHVRQRLEQRPRVLYVPLRVLKRQDLSQL